METVTICGSMRFSQEMKEIAFMLESRHGLNVLQCTYNEQGVKITPDMLENLEQAHFVKISLSDWIYVVDIGHYIGDAVRKEIAYAEEHGKKVVFHSSGLYDTAVHHT